MTTNRKTPLALILIQTLALTACGGGGGGSDSGGGSKAAALPPHQIDEGETETFGTASASSASSVKSSSSLIHASLSGQGVRVTAEQVDRPSSAVLTFSNSDGKAVGRMNIAINNTSAASLESEAAAFLNGRAQLLNLVEARAYYDLETAQSYMDGNINGTTFQSLQDNWKVEQQGSYQALESALDSLDQVRTDYEKGRVSDDDLLASVSAAEGALNTHNVYADLRFSAASGVDASIAFPNSGTLEYYEPSGSFSRFVGNRSLGQETSGGWQFDSGQEKYEFLASFRAKADSYAGAAQ
ncbi:hypothetical protein EZI54_06810 [Marinobacter halodurans]|uniref:DUF4349 domain-containing protein n=1 Tax=Marinobacter halodurans TaxID=2528979 RepID=A0ABY1ZME6_9GAMM|nr:hypothetical protein [Marinobacter halodurans]TBW57361.1 hypothetical protein EZI54_06810 [Marinobacter halodurans]